jgi:diacylglycerol kinase (ATP)
MWFNKQMTCMSMKKNEPFSLRARGKSFKYAINGAAKFFRSEHNAFLHLAGTLFVIVMSVLTQVSKSEIIFLALATGLVWTAELFNTAIEKIMDFISIKTHPEIKYIKDIAAAAVLVAAIVAFITGCIVFIPKL